MELYHNRYEIMKHIGKGGMAEVFQVRDHRLNMNFAMKCIYKSHCKSENNFFHEIHILSLLHHKGIPRIIDQFEDVEYYYVIMDLISGYSLMQCVIDHDLISKQTIINWMLQIIDMFIYLHSLQPYKLFYIDLKPQNIILSKDGSLHLIDFGSSCLENKNHVISATPTYAPKDVLINHRGSVNSDIYSFGITFYVIYHGSFPEMDKGKKDLDKILYKCYQQDRDGSFHTFISLKKAVKKYQIRQSKRFLHIIFCLLAAIVFVSLGGFQYHLWRQYCTEEFYKALQKKNYEEAIRWRPSNVEPYEYLIENKCYVVNNRKCKIALYKIEEIAIHYNVQKSSDIAFLIASHALSLHNDEGYKKAYKYLSYVSYKSEEEQEFIDLFMSILEIQTRSQSSEATVKKLEVYVKKIEPIIFHINDIEKRYKFACALLSIYDVNQREFSDSEERMIKLCDHIIDLLNHNPRDIKFHDIKYFSERKANLYYEQGMKYYDVANFVAMKESYEISILLFEKIGGHNQYMKLADMKLSCFEFAIENESKSEYVYLLKDAKKFAERIEIQENRQFMLDMIISKIEFWSDKDVS